MKYFTRTDDNCVIVAGMIQCTLQSGKRNVDSRRFDSSFDFPLRYRFRIWHQRKELMRPHSSIFQVNIVT